ncbi:MAG: leukotoxin LktA family filamentous adhesin, partial [Pseudomonadota bacterium]|nr:leukotoxin LktA family filamentous adhesin [Pseudomonadota bacterium]
MSSKRSFVARKRVAASHSPQALSRKPIVTAVCTALGLACSPHAGADSLITTDGRTATTVTVAGNDYDITTATISQNGRTGFNSFHDFSVDAADTVKLHLPEGTDSLVNLVWDSQAVINGRLDALLPDGAVGGKVFFADPHGVVIGGGAMVNVGALALSAPTH